MSPNNAEPRRRGWFAPVVHLSNNWMSLAGVVLVTTSTIFWLFLLPTELRGGTDNPYLGILAFLVLPGPFFAGLIMIPVGIWRRHRLEGRTGIHPLDQGVRWSNPEMRRLAYFVGVTTLLNIVIASQLSYGAVSYMDTVTFCGKTCHNVMQPEYTAYLNSPHSRVECVKCHIGPGAGWFVKSKLSGVGQVFAVAFNTYPRPIPTPVHNLRPARETCEACHWPQKYGEDRVRVISNFADDQANSATKTVLLMRIGGGNNGIGIHGTHLGPGVLIRYGHSDEARQTIPWVEYNGADGKRVVYAAPGAKPDGAGLDIRDMDCMDCHNRPSHTYELPERAVNKAMASGLISSALPFAKKRAVEILKVAYASRDEAARRIPEAFAAFYRQSYPAIWAQRQAEVTSSGNQVLAIYDRNIFPDMNVTWGKYPNNIGHTDFPGCWRCHDANHTAQSGAVITQDCNACHNMLADDEANPKILTDLGITEAKAR
jgi:hypothetical protein